MIRLGIAKIFGLLLLITSGISFGYLVRIGYIGESFMTRWSPFVITQVGAIVVYLFRPGLVTPYIKRVGYLRIILITIVCTTILAYVYTRVTEFVTPFSITIRLLVQALSLMSGLVSGAIIARLVFLHPKAAYRGLLVGLALVIAGIVFQIATEGLGGVVMNRLYGISGEPKGLALYVVPFIVAFALVSVESAITRIVILFLLLAILVFTSSATGFLALILSFVVSIIAVFGFKARKYIVFVSTVVILLGSVIVSSDELSASLIGRVVERAQGVYTQGIATVVELPYFGLVAVDGNDAPAIRWILDNPLIVIFGNGYGFETVFSYPYMVNYDSGFLTEDYQGYITPNLALVENVLNYGVLLLILMTVSVIRGAKRFRGYFNPAASQYIFIFFLSLYCSALLVMRTPISLMFSYVVIMSMSSAISLKSKKLKNGEQRRLNAAHA